MTISVQRTVIVEPQVTQVMIIVGSNDHLQSRGLLTRLTDESVTINEVMEEAIMTLLLVRPRTRRQCSDTSRRAW